MLSESFREACFAEPFQPFLLRLTDGREIPVLHREFVVRSPGGGGLLIYQPDESYSEVDPQQVAGVEFRPAAELRRRPRPA